jgi:hypothetical protein
MSSPIDEVRSLTDCHEQIPLVLAQADLSGVQIAGCIILESLGLISLLRRQVGQTADYGLLA